MNAVGLIFAVTVSGVGFGGALSAQAPTRKTPARLQRRTANDFYGGICARALAFPIIVPGVFAVELAVDKTENLPAAKSLTS